MRKRLFIIAVTVLWIFSTGMAFGAPVGKFTDVKGLVDLTATDGSSREIKVGDPVSVGDIVRTKSRSSAEITFSDSSVVRLARNSRLKINEYMVGKQETRGILKLFRGKAQSIVSKAVGFFGFKKKNKFEMHTPTAVCGVRGTNFFTWYQEGVSGSAVKEGTVYTYANNRPQEVKEVNAGQSSMVVSSDAPPVIRKATDEDLSLGGDEEGGEPFAFVDEEQPEELSTFGLGESVSASDTEEQKVEVPADGPDPDFAVTLTGGFLNGDGNLSGYLDDGALAFSGTLADGTTAGAMAVGSDLVGGGAFEGYLGGALGSWEGLFTSIYVNPDGGAGFITGSLSDTATTGNQVDATGSVKKDGVLGFVRGGDQAGFELELDDWTYPTPGLPGTGVAALKLLAAANPDNTMVEGVEIFDAARVNDENAIVPDLLLGIYSETGSGFLDLDAGFGGLTQTGTITYEDDPMAYYLAGYVQVGNDEAGHVSISDYGKLSYLDPLYHGTYTLGLRGVYDTGTGLGDYASAGTIELEPLDFSVSWAGSMLGGENNLFYDDAGSKEVAAAQYGLLGFVDNGDGYDLYAAGDYSAAVVDVASVSNPDAPLLWHSFLGDGLMAFPIMGVRESVDAEPENGFMGFTAGLWRVQGGYGVLDGAVAGIRMTGVFDDQGETLVAYELERVFGGLGGDFFPDDLAAPNLSGLWRAEGVAQADTMTVDPDNLFMHRGILFAQMAGAFVDDTGNLVSGTDIQGAGMGMALSFLDFPDGDSTGIFTLGLGNLGGMGSILIDFQEVGAFDVDPSGMSGNFYTGSPGAWTARIGGMSSGMSLAGGGSQVDSLDDGAPPIPIFMGNDIGFFLATVQNGLMGESGDVTGSLDGTYMTLTHMAHLDGLVYGQQTAGEGGGTWIAHSVGTIDQVDLLAWSAMAYGGYHYYGGGAIYRGDSYNGVVGALDSPFESATVIDTAGAAVDLDLMGIAYSDGLGSWWGPLEQGLVGDIVVFSDSGEGYGGFMGGRTSTRYAYGNSTEEDFEGNLVSLYVNGGDAGILSGSFDGDYYLLRDSMGMFTVSSANPDHSGTLQATKKATGYDRASYSIASNDIHGWYSGGFYGEPTQPGTLGANEDLSGILTAGNSIRSSSNGYLGSRTSWLVKDGVDEDWGIFSIELGGDYEGTTSTDWDLHLGGRYWRDLDENDYWVASIDGSDWSGENGDQRIAGILDGRYMTPYALGTITGDVLGSFDNYDSGQWEAIALGTFEEDPLAWSAMAYGGYHYYDDDEIDWEDEYDAVVGAKVSPYNTATVIDTPGSPVDLDLIGKAWPDDLGSWWGTLEGDFAGGSAIPQDFGDYGGFLGGRTGTQYAYGDSTEEDFEGYLVSLYVNGDDAGVLEGDFKGSYYPLRDDMGMFAVSSNNPGHSGSLTATKKADGYESGDYSLDFNYIDGRLSGHFSGSGAISNSNTIWDISMGYLMSQTAWLVKGETSEDWGIFNIELGGHYLKNPDAVVAAADGSDAWTLYLGGDDWRDLDDTEYWTATVAGSDWSGADGDQRIAGTLSGRYMTTEAIGTISGDVLGSFDNAMAGLWEAIALGTFQELPLYYYGGLAGMAWWAGGEGSNYEVTSVIEGLAGVHDYIDGKNITFMGEHSVNTPLWAMGVQGGVPGVYEFMGLVDFNSDGNRLDGHAVGIYRGADGYGGFLLFHEDDGDGGTYSIDGTYYGGTGYWDADGVVAMLQMTPDGYPNYGSLSRSPLPGGGIAIAETDRDFFGTYLGESLSISGENWGVFRMLAYGYHDADPGDGEDEEGYWLASSIGTHETGAAGYDYGGYVYGYFLSESEMGRFSGEMGGETLDAWTLASGAEAETPDIIGYWGEDEGESLYTHFPEGGITQVGEDNGLIGIANTGGAYHYLAMGQYMDWNGIAEAPPYVWTTGFAEETDALSGSTVGVWKDGEMNGDLVALYDTGAGAGLLAGAVLGNYYETEQLIEVSGTGLPPESSGFTGRWLAEGPLTYVLMEDGSAGGIISESFTEIYGQGDFANGGYIETDDEPGFTAFQSYANRHWGIWDLGMSGSYGGGGSNLWWMSLAQFEEEVPDTWFEVAGYRWEDGEIAADVAGAWVDLDSAVTGVMGGNLKGTFDPGEAATWVAVANGAFMDTETFLAMVSNNPEALQALNIPSFEVGRADLRGSGGGVAVNMWDTTFFAHMGGSPPSLWASGSVTGTNPGAVTTAEVPVSGNGLNAIFNLNSYAAGGNWTASVDGGYGPVGDQYVSFHGAAAGQAVGATDPRTGDPVDFTGTASGVAAPSGE